MDKKFRHLSNIKRNPTITIVTVVFNGCEFLEKTIQSVVNQTYKNVEYIIIDGGSTDGTLDILRKYQESIDILISESDAGIYDAMNKGILLANGEWINFMNSGDVFNSSDTLSIIFNSKKYSEEILFGDVHIRYSSFDRIQCAGKIEDLWRGMQFSHQSSIVKTDFHKKNLFNINNKIAADLEFYYKSQIKGFKFRKLNLVLASVNSGGVSDAERIETINAWMHVVVSIRNEFKIKIYYYFLKSEMKIRLFTKKILPKKIIDKIIMAKK